MERTIDVVEVWDQTLEEIAAIPNLSPQHRGFIWLTSPRELSGNTLTLAVPDDFICKFVNSHLKPLIIDTVNRVASIDVELQIIVDPSVTQGHDDETTDILADSTFAGPTVQPDSFDRFESADASGFVPAPGGKIIDVRDSIRSTNSAKAEIADNNHRLNKKYTFDTFVIGSSNRFAHAYSIAVAEQPAKAYNPMFVYGSSGLGKTHLLHAIGHYTRALYSGTRVCYVTAEEFTNDFVDSIKSGQADSFKARYRNVDVLLVDDIQFLANKEGSQEEFFHTFNTLHNSNKQIVVTSDLPPKQLINFEDRLRSRFEWGLIADIQPPDLETRIAILRKKAAAENIHVDPEVMEFIASRIKTNIRELEGALLRVTAFANIQGSHVDTQIAELVLKDLIAHDHAPQVTPQLILQQSAEFYGISTGEMCSKARNQTLVHARQISMYLCRELTSASFPTIGDVFGGRDHTTVMYANKKVESKMATDPLVYDQISKLTSLIKNGAV